MLFLPSSDRLSLRFSPLTVCLAMAGWKAPKRHWLAQTSVSLVCYLLLPSTISSSSSLSSPSPYYVPQELAARSRARMPEKIFPRRCHPLERKNPPHPDFCTFFPPSRPSSPTLSLSDLDIHRTYGPRPRNFSLLYFTLFRQFIYFFSSVYRWPYMNNNTVSINNYIINSITDTDITDSRYCT